MHSVDEDCPVVKMAIDFFGEEDAMLILYNETCFPMDDVKALKQLEALIDKRRTSSR